MISRFKLLAVCGFLLGCPATRALADDASFFGDGATVFAVKENHILMRKENIIVRSNADTGPNIWKADCTFVFSNTSSQAVDVQMGFPDWKIWGEGQSAWAIQDFIVNVNDKEVTPTHKDVVPQKDKGMTIGYEGAYTWLVHFAPNSIVTVHNVYTFGGFSGNGPFRSVYQEPGFPSASTLFWHTGGKAQKVNGFDFDDGLIRKVQYIVTTAKTWAGPIGEADIAIELPPKILAHLLIPTPPATSMGNGFIHWHYTHWTPTQEIAVYVVVPHFSEDQTENQKINGPLFSSVEQAKAWIQFAKKNGVKSDVVESLRDAYLARYGNRLSDVPSDEKAIMAVLDQFYEKGR